MAEKKATKAAAPKAAPAKATAKKAAPAKKATLTINAITVGFNAGDVYETLNKAGKALTVAEIAKLAKISEKETLLGLGWLFREGKIKDEENKVALA